jgi:stage V sporulation protein AD
MSKKVGIQSVKLANPPVLISRAAVVGPKEGQGPLREFYDYIYSDNICGQASFEKAERHMVQNACYLALNSCGKIPKEMDYFLAGDLLNQTTTSSFSAVQLEIPFFGLYGACSTMGESLSLAAMLIDGGFADYVLAATSSHNSTSERQYRYPTEYGGQRPPYAQWTVTGAGAAVVAKNGQGPRLTWITTGKVMDMGIKDPFNMGAAMAPAAAKTIIQHFCDTGRGPDYYDLIVTGDLGRFGHDLTVKLAISGGGFDLSQNYQDCGMMIYDGKQDVHSGGSGCGCSAVVTYGCLLKEMAKGTYDKVLVVATGALHSPTTFQQGENIPAIAHAVALENLPKLD